jgi:hypothetical protein
MHASRIRPVVNTHRHWASNWAIDDANLIMEIKANQLLLKKRKKVIVQEIIASHII